MDLAWDEFDGKVVPAGFTLVGLKRTHPLQCPGTHQEVLRHAREAKLRAWEAMRRKTKAELDNLVVPAQLKGMVLLCAAGLHITASIRAGPAHAGRRAPGQEEAVPVDGAV